MLAKDVIHTPQTAQYATIRKLSSYVGSDCWLVTIKECNKVAERRATGVSGNFIMGGGWVLRVLYSVLVWDLCTRALTAVQNDPHNADLPKDFVNISGVERFV